MTFIDNNTMSHDINFGGVGNCNTPCGLSTQTGGKFIILRNVRRKAHAKKMLPAKLICTQQFYTILFAFEFQLFFFQLIRLLQVFFIFLSTHPQSSYTLASEHGTSRPCGPPHIRAHRSLTAFLPSHLSAWMSWTPVRDGIRSQG